MANDVYSAPCPCCSAPLRFDGGEGKLHCDSLREPIRAGRHAPGGRGAQPGRAGQRSELAAPGDGGMVRGGTGGAEELYLLVLRRGDCRRRDHRGATECVYCGSASILPGQISGSFRPRRGAPLRQGEAGRPERLPEPDQGQAALAPSSSPSENRIEKITGVYVPFWKFGCDADADITYRAERKTSHRSGDYMITDTDHFLVLRGGGIGFGNVPVDGSSKFDDAMMEAIEPFDSHGEAGVLHCLPARLPGGAVRTSPRKTPNPAPTSASGRASPMCSGAP